MTARVLILDFGGVISRTLFETHPQTEQALGLPAGTLEWRGPFAPETDSAWRDMQAGTITERDYWALRTREVGRLVGRSWSQTADFVRAARGADPERVIRPEAAAIIGDAHSAGRKLAILSNELDLFYGAEFRERLPLLDAFDVIVDGSYSGVLKPDPDAYLACLTALAAEAGDCLFIDDQPRNTAGATALGIQTILLDVRDPARGFAEARTRLGLQPQQPGDDNDA